MFSLRIEQLQKDPLPISIVIETSEFSYIVVSGHGTNFLKPSLLFWTALKADAKDCKLIALDF